MIFTKYRNSFRWIIIVISFVIISLILWNTYVFFQNFKAEERTKMDIWAKAQSDVINSDTNSNLDLTLKILSSNSTTPMIVINTDGSLSSYNNVNEAKMSDNNYVKRLVNQFKNENTPIEISYQNEVLATIYYGNSALLNKLKYYPLALLLIIILFGGVVFFFYRSNKNAIENKLWSGMAKETAHQIGTPLSSLIGWTEILKSENVNPNYISEIEKDIDRLQTLIDCKP